MKDFTPEAYASFSEAAAEKYDFAACKSGEKMTFGKCQKVGGSGEKKKVPQSLKDSKAQAERMLASAKKRNNQNQIRKAQRMVESANKKIDQFSASEDAQEFKSGCPDGFRSKGSQTVAGQRREVCCSPDGKTCMTADGIPL